MRHKKNMFLGVLLCGAVAHDADAIRERYLNKVVVITGAMTGMGAAVASNLVNCCTGSCGMVEGCVAAAFAAFFANTCLSMRCPERLFINARSLAQSMAQDCRLSVEPGSRDFIEKIVNEQQRKEGRCSIAPLNDALGDLKRLRREGAYAQGYIKEWLDMADPPAEKPEMRTVFEVIRGNAYCLHGIIDRLENSEERRQEQQCHLQNRIREVADWD